MLGAGILANEAPVPLGGQRLLRGADVAAHGATRGHGRALDVTAAHLERSGALVDEYECGRAIALCTTGLLPVGRSGHGVMYACVHAHIRLCRRAGPTTQTKGTQEHERAYRPDLHRCHLHIHGVERHRNIPKRLRIRNGMTGAASAAAHAVKDWTFVRKPRSPVAVSGCRSQGAAQPEPGAITRGFDLLRGAQAIG